jgi:hypothetical protein
LQVRPPNVCGSSAAAYCGPGRMITERSGRTDP